MPNLASTFLLSASLLGLATTSCVAQEKTSSCLPAHGEPSNAQIMEAFGKQGIRINGAEAQGVRPNVLLALQEARRMAWATARWTSPRRRSPDLGLGMAGPDT